MRKELTEEQEEFLRELVLRYGDMLTMYAYRFYGYQPHMLETAQDAVQETFIKAVCDVEKLMVHPNQVGWLKVSMRYILLNKQQDPRWQAEQLEPIILDSQMKRMQRVLEAFDELEKLPRLDEVIAAAKVILRKGESETFYDHFLVGLTTKETALVENTSYDVVRGRISRIRKKLRKYFGLSCLLLVILFYN